LIKPLRKIFREDLECEQCGRQGYVDSTHSLGAPADEYEEDFLALPLAELGVPRFDMLAARGNGGVEAWLELTGDGSPSLGWERGLALSRDEESTNARS
jgi:hypothetical protein